MDIIPAIDIIDGACVRLTQGDYGTKKVYDQNPLDIAKGYEDAGCRRLHLVDLDGAKAGRVINHRVLEQITGNTSLVVDFGGGIGSTQDIETVFASGAAMVTGGSIAVRNRELFLSWLQQYGPGRIILGADARNKMVSVSGWTEDSQLEVTEFIMSYLDLGIRQVISTDIGVDGMMTGPSVELYRHMLETAAQSGRSLNLIASGGVSGIKDLDELKVLGVSGVIIGKALYEQTITLKQVSAWIAQEEKEESEGC